MKSTTRSYSLSFATVFVFLLLIIGSTRSVHAQKAFYWEAFDVDIRLLENGDLDITEHQTINFSGGDFTFGYATIDINRLDKISNVSVREGDQVYTESFTPLPATFSVNQEGGEYTIDWYFAPTQGRHTYTFSYTVEGAVRVEDNGNQLFWMAIPQNFPAHISRSKVTVQLPPGVEAGSTTALLGGDESKRTTTTISDDKRRVTVEAEAISSGQTLEVGVRFPANQLVLNQPDWQRAESLADTANLGFLAISILIFLGTPLLVMMHWYNKGRDPEVGPIADYLAEPPSNLAPALAGSLIDETADMHDIISILIDLARRGYINIDERQRDHTFIRTDKSWGDVAPYEMSLLKAVFGNQPKRQLSALKYKFSPRLPEIRSKMYRALVSAEFFRRSPETVRNTYLGMAFALLAVSVIAIVALISLFPQAALAACLGAAVIPGGLLFLYVAGHMPRKTELGAIEAAKWRAFERYLKDIEKYTNLDEAADIFEKYLPYAVAFGLDRSWIRKFSKAQRTPRIPTWYGPYYHTGRGGRAGRSRQSKPATEAPSSPGGLDGMADGLGGGLESMSSGLSRMLNSSSTVLESVKPAPKSSGGGFSGGFSGGSSGGGGRGFG